MTYLIPMSLRLMQNCNILMAYFSPVQSQGIAFCSFDTEMTNCEFPAHCVNTSRGVSCLCSDGYIGDPPQCEGKCYWLGIYPVVEETTGKTFLDTMLILSICFTRFHLAFMYIPTLLFRSSYCGFFDFFSNNMIVSGFSSLGTGYASPYFRQILECLTLAYS